MKILFLGTGTSTGVPVIGCNCDVCQSTNPKNKRLRSSILITSPHGTKLLIDSCTDLREQALRYHLTAIDAILYTHPHLDHVSGFDELRAFCWNRSDKLPLYAGPQTLDQLKSMYQWAFLPSNTYKGYIRPEAHNHEGKPFSIDDITITPVPVLHGSVECYGYLFTCGESHFAYLPDVKSIPETSMELLQGISCIAMDGLGLKSHPTHLSISENVELITQLQAKCAYITHSGHALEYELTERALPPHMHCAYDGLTLAL